MAYMKDSTGRRLDSFQAISATEVATALAGSVLNNRLGPVGVNPLPAVTSDVPTFTWGTSATVTGRQESALSENLTVLGRRGTWNTGAGRAEISGNYTGREFYMDGDTFELSFVEATANSTRLWFWVDDLPATSTPGLGLTTAGGSTYFVKLVFGSAKRRKITVYASTIQAWGAFRFPVTTTITPSTPKPVVTIVSDSFSDGSAASPMLQAVGVTLSRLLGVDIINASVGGTGYLAGAETFGAAARVTRGTERTPELIVFMGSVNDSTSTGLEAAATAAYNAWSAAAPNVPIIVFGVQPSNAADTISSGRAQRNAAVRAAAEAHPAVVAFHEMVGFSSATPPSAYSAGTTYGPGDRVTYQGSIWQISPFVTNTASGITPGGSSRWQLLTYAYTGTGKVGSTTGDGTRDVMLNADGIHPEVAGSIAIAQRLEIAIRTDLAAL